MKRALLSSLEETWRKNTGEKVAFVPDLRILNHMTPRECLDVFAQDWGADNAPLAVCLPLIGVDGVAFDSVICPTRPVSVKMNATRVEEKTLGQVARDFVDLGCTIFLYVCPSMEFLKVESCHVLDIRNMGSPQACVHKQRTKDVLKYLIASGVDHVVEHLDDPVASLRGVAVDITDLWGMNGEHGKLSLTCFCDECRVYLEEKGVHVNDFENYPNPWYLALKDAGRAIAYIDNIAYGEIPSSIVGKSALRGFDELFESENEKLKAAGQLMKYMVCRHEMVEDCLTTLYDVCEITQDQNATKLRRIAIVEGTDYDWTSGVFPASLKSPVVDEVWLDPSDKFPHIAIPHKTFMWRRATYFLQAFFQILSNAADRRMRTTTGLSRLSVDEMKKLLEQRGSMALNHELRGLGQLTALSPVGSSARNGIVGVILTEQVIEDLLRNPEIAPGMGEHRGIMNLQMLRQMLEKQEDQDAQKQ